MTLSLVSSGKAPLLSGQKIAVASRLAPLGAQLLAATFEDDTPPKKNLLAGAFRLTKVPFEQARGKALGFHFGKKNKQEKSRSITDVSVMLDFSYIVKVPAANASITFHWDRLKRHYDDLEAKYTSNRKTKTKSYLWGLYKRKTITVSRQTYEEMQSEFDFLDENEIVEMQFDETYPDESVDVLREAFFQYFLNQFTEEGDPEEAPATTPSEQEKETMPNMVE
ncbi:MAG: hypothetical protein GKR87_13135 [Kiritimatiellae bacterium]|nr:hypothetical protein [Kiritimatiellia bacterium]